jgi:hypothetical protein
VIEDWRHDYNHHRPHSGLAMMTPSAFSAGSRTYLEAVSEHLSPPGGSEQWLAETTTTTRTTTTTTNRQLSQQVDG